MNEIRETTLLGFKLSCVTVPELHDFVGRQITVREKTVILYLNLHGFRLAFRLPWLRDFFLSARVVICDGDGLRLGLKLLGKEAPVKIGLTRWIWEFAEFCQQKGYSLYLLGAGPGVADQAAQRLCARYPKLRIAGTHDGYFSRQGTENEKLICEINRLKPDILIAAFGMPLQEEWLRENREKLDVPILLSGGGVLDYAAGRLGEAPSWMIRAKLEWLFRIYEEPGRLFWRYAVEIPYFFWKVLIEALSLSISRLLRK